MSVIVMEVKAVEDHPNANALKVYKFVAPGIEKQIVANLENIYSLGDRAFVALDGTTLKDGLKIKTRKVRGVKSEGMALGFTDNFELLGLDFSELFCPDMPKHPLNVPGYNNSINQLAKDVSRIRYDKLADFVALLSSELQKQADNDFEKGRTNLSDKIGAAGDYIEKSIYYLGRAWEICEPHMEEENE